MRFGGLSSRQAGNFAMIDSFFGTVERAMQEKLQLFHLRERLRQRDGELIGAGRILEAAADAAHTLDGVFGLHALDKAGNALKVAVAAADDRDTFDGVVIVQLDAHFLGADALGTIMIDHFDISLSYTHYCHG